MLPIAQEHGQVAREHESGCSGARFRLPGSQLSITFGRAIQVARLPGSTTSPEIASYEKEAMCFTWYRVGNASQVAREHTRVSTCDELPGSMIESIAQDHDSPFTFS